MYDVIVSGAGPAGSHAAYCCAKRGLRTLLVERDDLPREKCCAGGVLERALKQLDFPLPETLIEKEIRGFSIVHGSFRRNFRFDRRAGITVDRGSFDLFLAKKAEKAGAEILSGKPVDRAEDGDIATVGVNGEVYQSKVLIVAEGATSSSARQIIGPYPGSFMSMGMACTCSFWYDPGDAIEIHLIGTPTVSLQKGNIFPLNGWMFPHQKGANIGVAGKGEDAEELKKALRRIVSNSGERWGGVESVGKIRAHPIPLVPRSTIVGRRCMLVGDAAGFANPITGEGMSYALSSGRMAAEAAANLVEKGDMRSLRRYQDACLNDLVRDLRAAHFIGPWLHWLVGVVDTDRFFTTFHQSGKLVETCLSIARGEANWTHLLRSTIPRFPKLFFSSLS